MDYSPIIFKVILQIIEIDSAAMIHAFLKLFSPNLPGPLAWCLLHHALRLLTDQRFRLTQIEICCGMGWDIQRPAPAMVHGLHA